MKQFVTFLAYTIGGCNVGLKVQTEISIGLTAMKSCYDWDHIDSSFVLRLYYCFFPTVQAVDLLCAHDTFSITWFKMWFLSFLHSSN